MVNKNHIIEREVTTMGRKFKYQEVKDYIEALEYKLISTKYINSFKHLEIECNKGHTYSASFDRIRQGRRCPICRANEKGDRIRKRTTEDIKSVFEKYGFKVEIDNYIDEKQKYKVVCSNKHVFETSWRCFKNSIDRNKNICQECRRQDYLKTLKEKMTLINYKVISDKYTSSNTKISIECDKGHMYKATPDNIKRGNRCPVCNISKGEEAIRNFLNRNFITFDPQKTYDNCRYKWVLRFDFYIPDLNILIEYDGIQHFEPIEFFGKSKGLKEIQKRDQIKNEYCKNNKITLIRIPYYDFEKINYILTENVLKPLINKEKTSTTKSS